MSADDTIVKADRWIRKLNDAYQNDNQQEIEDNLSALLPVIRSIPEHLLEDANVHYGLNIPLNKRELSKEFKSRAHDRSQVFYDWWNAEMTDIRSDAINSALMNKRNIEIHRKTQKPDLSKVNIGVDMSSMASVSAFVGKSEEEVQKKFEEHIESEDKKISKKSPQNSNIQIDYFFQDLPDINVLQASVHFLDTMKNLVQQAKDNHL